VLKFITCLFVLSLSGIAIAEIPDDDPSKPKPVAEVQSPAPVATEEPAPVLTEEPAVVVEKTEEQQSSKIDASEFKKELRINQLLRGLRGAAFAVKSMDIKGSGDIDYFIREYEVANAALGALSKWMEDSLKLITDPSMKVVFETLIKSTAKRNGSGDTSYWIQMCRQRYDAARSAYSALSGLMSVSNKRLESHSVASQLRDLAEKEPQSFGNIMTDDMVALIKELQTNIAEGKRTAAAVEASVAKEKSNLSQLEASVAATTAKLAEVQSQYDSIKTDVEKTKAEIEGMFPVATRGQIKVVIEGLEKVRESVRAQLNEDIRAEGFAALEYLRRNVNGKPKGFPFNPNLTLTISLKRISQNDYRWYRLRRGVRLIAMAGTLTLDINDQSQASTVEGRFASQFKPGAAKPAQVLNSRTFFEKKAFAEIGLMQKIAAGTAKYEDVLAKIQSRLSEQCDVLLANQGFDSVSSTFE
jgi:hypothetical protein